MSMPTHFLPFGELTFPDVAALPRDLPLILPLGRGYDEAALAGLLGNPLEAALLPALPFGRPGSGLDTPGPVFSAVVRNLLANMSEDGFTRVYALSPAEGVLEADIPQLVLRPDPFLAGDAARMGPLPAEGEQGKVVLVPVGHTEQHGYHSPLSTDTIIIEAIMQGTAAAAPELATCLPAYPYGVSTHRPYLDGTFNVGGRAFEDFWGAVIDTLVRQGFSRFYFNSGHGVMSPSWSRWSAMGSVRKSSPPPACTEQPGGSGPWREARSPSGAWGTPASWRPPWYWRCGPS
jgi:hypothetical protein